MDNLGLAGFVSRGLCCLLGEQVFRKISLWEELAIPGTADVVDS